MTSKPARAQEPIAARQVRNTAEPSGELSVGDVVVIGDTALACDAVGFREIPRELNEVRESEHGTHPMHGQ